MIYKNYKKYGTLLLLVLPVVLTSCAGTPKYTGEQFSQWHYTFTVLLRPEELDKSPKLEIALSLLKANYPPKLTEFLNDLLYSTNNIDVYKDMIIRAHREQSRKNMNGQGYSYGEEELPYFNWRYVERINVSESHPKGVMIERDVETYVGGAHQRETKRYYVIDLEELRQVKIDDLFGNFQGDAMRKIIYAGLRKYSKLDDRQPLSAGIYFTDSPELSFNFFITWAGLGLHWDPFEIAPHSEGGIDLIIPWWTIRPLMLRSGMETLTKFGINLLD